jgi:DNA-binding MarR family transcriptional regulator
MDPDSIANLLETVVVGAVGLTTRALAEAAPHEDLTFPQWRALLVVGEEGDGLRVGQVAARVGVTLPATSRLLRRLARRDLVALTTDETDRRATRARLTARGTEVRMAILGYRRAELVELATGMRGPGADRTLAALAAALGRYA